MRRLAMFVCLKWWLCGLFPVAAQEAIDTPPEPLHVEIAAEDGQRLVGDFYAVPDAEDNLPGVLLLHGYSSNRMEWRHLIGPMLDHGFHVLAVDQRGSGDTGGVRDLVAAIGDVPLWLAWMREQANVDDAGLSTIGSSWGTVPALAGCAADAACVTAIVLSPGDFPLLDVAMFDAISDRSVLIVAGKQDSSHYDAAKLFDRATGEAAMYSFDTGTHGSAFVSPRSSYRERVLDMIFGWLNDHLEWAKRDT